MSQFKINKKKKFCKTKIICTLGPASDHEDILEKMIEEGLDAARFNFSHGSHEEAKERLDRFRKVEAKMGLKLPVILDTKGPEIRLGKFSAPVTLEVGQEFTLTTKPDVIGCQNICSVSHKGLPQDLKEGDTVLIDDGLVEMTVTKVTDTDVVCKVKNKGIVKSNKGVNLPNIKTSLPSLTEKDIGDIKFGADNGFDFIAASFIRTKQDVVNIKEYCTKFGAPNIQIIAKIENQEGLDNFDDILSVADGIMVARGDLGVEIPVERLPIEQKRMIRKCNKIGKLVITATQMLDSMQENPRPTRAEVSDVSNAIIDGSSIIMLSGETAAGKYPVEAVRYMNTIALETERHLNLTELTQSLKEFKNIDIQKEEEKEKVLSYSTCVTANLVKASAIICTSNTGRVPGLFSFFRPKAPIFAITSNEKTAKILSLYWGVQPAYVQGDYDHDTLVEKGIEEFKKMKLLVKGDLVVVNEECTKDKSNKNQVVSAIMTVN